MIKAIYRFPSEAEPLVARYESNTHACFRLRDLITEVLEKAIAEGKSAISITLTVEDEK